MIKEAYRAGQIAAFEKTAVARWQKVLRSKIINKDTQGIEMMAERMGANSPGTNFPIGDTHQQSMRNVFTRGFEHPEGKKLLDNEGLYSGMTRWMREKHLADKRNYPIDQMGETLKSEKSLKGHLSTRRDIAEFYRKKKRGERNPAYESWAQATKADPESWVDISHGGTTRNVETFLGGNTPSNYKSNEGWEGPGMWVSPNAPGRTLDYAHRAGEMYGGRVSTMTGKIQAKHLAKVRNNGYEAFLPSENLKHIQSPNVQRAHMDTSSDIDPDTIAKLPHFSRMGR